MPPLTSRRPICRIACDSIGTVCKRSSASESERPFRTQSKSKTTHMTNATAILRHILGVIGNELGAVDLQLLIGR